ncbi:hypothetical protein ACEPPN_015608 [Leptodophora sp. 'Broadleaf-Isolate-01']
MFPGTPDVQARGFFFDLNPAKEGSISTSSTISNAAAKNRSNGQSPSVEWWEADTQHASTGNKTARPLNVDATPDTIRAESARTPTEQPAVPKEPEVPKRRNWHMSIPWAEKKQPPDDDKGGRFVGK